MTPEKLVSMALEAMQRAYAPYSGYKVGAALLCRDGSVVCGANIENAAYGPSNCAERTAIFTAVFEGKREFEAIAVVGGKDGVASDFFPPCGVCRQVLAELCDPAMPVFCGNADRKTEMYTLNELLPCSFGPKDLGK